MSKKLVLIFLAIAFVLAAGSIPKVATYQFTLYRPAAVNGSVLQPGSYKVFVRDAVAFVTAQDGHVVQAPVKIETAPTKFETSSLTIDGQGSNAVLSEIGLGGSKTKLLFGR